MKKTKIIASIVALSCTAGVLSAKPKANSSTPMNISVFSTQQREQPPADNMTYKWIKDNFGVTFTWDIAGERKDLRAEELIASGELPDLIEIDIPQFKDAGVLRDLKPLVEKYGPNLKKHYASAWKKMIDIDSERDAKGNITAEHIYTLPNYGVYDGPQTDTYFNQNGWWIQKAVLKEFGYPKIQTVDEYFDLIEKYYQKYPTIDGKATIPFSIITADWEAFNLWNPPQFLGGYPNEGNGHVDQVGKNFVYTDNFSDENARKWFKLANGYFQRGLIDPESFSDNRDQYYAKIKQGRVLGMFIQGWEFLGDSELVLWQAGKDERTYAPLPLTFDKSIKPRYRDQALPNLQRGFGISTKCPEDKAIKIIKFMDTMLKEENQRVLYWGFEGKDYFIDKKGTITGTKGAAYRTSEQRAQQKDPAWINANRAMLWAESAPKLEGKLKSGYTRNIEELPWEYEVSQQKVDLDLWKAYGVSSYAEFMDPNPPKNPGWYPMWQVNPEGEAAEAMLGFEAIQREYLPKIIMCKPSDFGRLWDEYCELLKPLTSVYNKYMQQKLEERIKKYGGIQK
jgi:putative aldouronate transport system substrate-binding protein